MYPRDGEPRPFLDTPFVESYATFSPDGRWLAYLGGQTGRPEIYVTPYPGPGPRIQISTDGGMEPAWSPTGREIFFRDLPSDDPMRTMWVVDISTEPSFSARAIRPLFKSDHLGSTPLRNYDVS